MDAMVGIVNWIIVRKGELLAIYTAIVTIASIIVKMTPTLSSNSKVLAVIKFLSKWVALNRTVNDEEVRKAVQAAQPSK